jgi:ATP-binding cassette subfamily B multidrug efflux pump
LLLTNGLAQAIPWLVKRTIESMERGAPAKQIALLAAMMIGLALGQALIRIISRIAIFNAGREAEFELRELLFARLCRLDGSYYRQIRTGELMSRLTNDLAAVRSLFGPGVLHAVNTVFAYAIALPLMLRIDGLLTLLALAPYPLLLLGARSFARGMYRRSHLQQQTLADMTSVLQEDLAGIRELKSYRLEGRRAEQFSAASLRYLRQALRLAVWRAGMLPFVGAGAGASLVLVIWVGSRAVVSGRLTLGDIVAMNLYVGLLAWPTMAVGWMVALWQRGAAAWQRLEEIASTEPQLDDPPPGAPAPSRAEVELRGLSVELDGRRILDQINFELRPGQICAVVGRVGSGKSTLVEAVARLVPVPTGTIFWDGVDVTALPLATVRHMVAYAPQDAFLFSQTLRQNIGFGLDPTVFTDPEQRERRIVEAVQIAGLEADIAALPDGLDTVVGERGVSLSGGQRQRVALARALVAHRPLLILDDSLSAVDAETERRIIQRLREALSDRTTLLTSHRLSALQHATTIVVLDNGRIVERGTHTELLARGGIYTQLYRRQLLEAPTP